MEMIGQKSCRLAWFLNERTQIKLLTLSVSCSDFNIRWVNIWDLEKSIQQLQSILKGEQVLVTNYQHNGLKDQVDNRYCPKDAETSEKEDNEYL